jgi:hypothetical protein
VPTVTSQIALESTVLTCAKAIGRIASWTWSGALASSNSLTILYAVIAASFGADAWRWPGG